ncbi:MAG: regulatory protein RecX [Solirubrobacteraceae bacterium]
MLETEERLARALELGFAFLNRRERTIDETRRHLEHKGIAAEATEAAVRALTERGYLDDGRFALLFVHDKRELEGWGSERIRRGLATKGIDRELVEAALTRHEVERAPGETELDRALALLQRRFPEPPCDRRERDRALGC